MNNPETLSSVETIDLPEGLVPIRAFTLEEDEYDGDYPEQRESEASILVFELSKEFQSRFAELLRDLPEGAAIIGGAARSAARKLITGDDEPVRDIDLVSLTDEDGNPLVDDDTCWALSHKYMPDDTENGHSMSCRSIESCFLGCDVTVNQCAIIDGQLLISEAAVRDFQNDTIRPSTMELDWSYDGDGAIKSRLAMRMLTMKASMEVRTGRTFELEDYNPRSIFYFDVAIALNKAMSRGRSEAESLCLIMEQYGAIPTGFNGDAIELASFLLRTGAVTDFEFRQNTAEAFMKEDEPYTIAIRALSRYGHGSSEVRDAISEYDDFPTSKYFSPAEYAEINANCRFSCFDEEEYEYEEDDDSGWDDDYDEPDDEYDEPDDEYDETE